MNERRSIRIVITGPESSGKTSLAKDLSSHFQALYIEEYARSYLQHLNRAYTIADMDKMAQEQYNLMYTKSSHPLIICDTGMIVMKVWCQVRFDTSTELIDHLHGTSDVDLYVLCTPDIPWQPDPLREHPFERDGLFDRYINELLISDQPFIIVAGSHSDRMKRSIDAIYFML